MSMERPKPIRVSILYKSKSKIFNYSKKPNVSKITKHHSLPNFSLVPIHYTTQEAWKEYRTRHTIHTHLATKPYLKTNQSNSNEDINKTRSLNWLKKKKFTVTKIPRQQSQEKKRSHSMPPTKIRSTIRSASNDTISGGSRNIRQSLSESLSGQMANNKNEIKTYQALTESSSFKNSNRIAQNNNNKVQTKHRSIVILLAAFAALIVALNGLTQKTTTIVIINEAAVNVTNSTTSSNRTTSTTTSTTTTAVNCSSSCLTQSWANSSGAIASWSFEYSFADSTNVYNGTPSSNIPSFVPGYVGQAASFNVTAKHAIYTKFIPLNNSSFTIAAWIRRIGDPGQNDYSIVGLCPNTANDNCLHVNIRAQKLFFGFYGDDLTSISNISLNFWTHVATTFDVNTRRQIIYINGFSDTQRTAGSGLIFNSGNFTIGTNEHVGGSNNFFQGYIDQLSINSRTQSSCEILEIATLAAYFKFDVVSIFSDSGPNLMTATASNYLIISGYINQAISLSGAPMSYFQAGSFTSFGIMNQAFSVTFWIKPQALSGTLLHLSTSSSGTGSVCFPLLGFASNGTIVAQVLTSNATVATVIGPVLPRSSYWTAVVQTWSSANGLKLYVNKTLVSSITASTFLASDTTPNYLTLGNCLSGCDSGCSSGLVGTPGPFTGVVDDWRIYSRELNSNDICTLYYY